MEIRPVDENVYATCDAITTHGNIAVDVTDKRLKAITRLRYLGDKDFGWADPSYAYGVLTDGTPVRVTGWDQLPYRRTVGRGNKAKYFKTHLSCFKFYLCEWARRHNVNLKELGAFDNLSFMD